MEEEEEEEGDFHEFPSGRNAKAFIFSRAAGLGCVFILKEC
jgi:hypothetical protein